MNSCVCYVQDMADTYLVGFQVWICPLAPGGLRLCPVRSDSITRE